MKLPNDTGLQRIILKGKYRILDGLNKYMAPTKEPHKVKEKQKFEIQ